MRQRKALDEQLRADKEHYLKGKTSPYITRVQCTDKKGFSPRYINPCDLELECSFSVLLNAQAVGP